MDADTPIDEALDELFTTIKSRKADFSEDSYTTTLFAHEKDENYVLKEPGGEMTETVLAAKDDDGEELLYKSTGLVCHLLILLSMKDASLDDLRNELEARF